MYFEILIFAAVIAYLLNLSGIIKFNKFINENYVYFLRLKESDYDFFVKAKYGEGIDPDYLFSKRFKNALLVFVLFSFMILVEFSAVTFLIVLGFTGFVFKLDYINLKSYYKKHLHEIDSMLPHYLKGLEILIQHYTVPVAIGKSIEDAPKIFKSGLQDMISAINSGDSSIEPYMDFARTYPVRDSMRMMRLLYRLGLGRQERKQEQLITFSKTISSLQQKSRDMRYAERLEKMENKTMSMLVTTGVGVMILLIIAVVNMMNL